MPSTKSQSVNKVQCRGHLPFSALNRRPILCICTAYIINIILQFSSLLILLQIRLTLPRRCCCHHNILEVLWTDWILPECQPCHCIIMSDFLPVLTREWMRRYWSTFANIYSDISWINSLFNFTHLWMLSSPSEQAWWLHPEIPNWLLLPINQRILERSFLLFLLLFQSLLLFFWKILLPLPLSHMPIIYWSKITLFQTLDPMIRPKHAFKPLPKVLQKYRLFHIIRLLHHREKRRHLFLLRCQVHRDPIIQHLHTMRLILWGKQHTMMLQRFPSNLCRTLLSLFRSLLHNTLLFHALSRRSLPRRSFTIFLLLLFLHLDRRRNRSNPLRQWNIIITIITRRLLLFLHNADSIVRDMSRVIRTLNGIPTALTPTIPHSPCVIFFFLHCRFLFRLKRRCDI
mmetsp:Transcript_10756/g.21365  ORF Transcript_10756/g.21365 Transcript_10756/m.21365 type:complete len:400 (+) Transcript_10756:873-2072(+)